jgi:hypothetical protein
MSLQPESAYSSEAVAFKLSLALERSNQNLTFWSTNFTLWTCLRKVTLHSSYFNLEAVYVVRVWCDGWDLPTSQMQFWKLYLRDSFPLGLRHCFRFIAAYLQNAVSHRSTLTSPAPFVADQRRRRELAQPRMLDIFRYQNTHKVIMKWCVGVVKQYWDICKRTRYTVCTYQHCHCLLVTLRPYLAAVRQTELV